MTEQSRHWDGISLGDATLAPYNASEWADQERYEHGQGISFPNYGVLYQTGDGTYAPLLVAPTAIVSTNIEIKVGDALVRGYLYENTATLTKAIGANASGNPRIDTVILRADFVAQTVRCVVKQGTPAASPARVALQQDTSIWEIPLADVAVANGFAVINPADVSDRRRAVHSLQFGWQPSAYPIGYIPNGNYDAASATFSSAADRKAIPFLLTSNMLLHDVLLRHVTTVVNYTIQWGLYFQDTNDGNTAENTLRLVASGTASGTTAGTQNIAIPSTAQPQFLAPGLYWLVINTPSFTGAGIAVGAIAGTSFDALAPGYRGGGAALSPIQQALDMVTGWTTFNSFLAVRLRGRVFGQSTTLG